MVDADHARLCRAPDGVRVPYEYELSTGRAHVEPEPDGTVEVRGGWAATSWGRRAAVAAIEDCPPA